MYSLMKAADSLLLNVGTFFFLNVTSPMELYVMMYCAPGIKKVCTVNVAIKFTSLYAIYIIQHLYVIDCPTNIFGRNNYFYILSDDQTNANTAQETCMNSSGILAETLDNTIKYDVIEYSVLRHIPSGLF